MKKSSVFLAFFSIFYAVIFVTGCTKQEPQPAFNQQGGVANPHMFQTTVTPEKVGPPTVLPQGKKPEEWVKEYYEAYKKGDFEKAYSYLPAVNKARETTENFKSSRSQMPITSFNIGTPVETKEGTATLIKIPVDIQSAGMNFQTTWVFEKRPDGTLIVKETQTSLGQ
jgi:hypothetical protein